MKNPPLAGAALALLLATAPASLGQIKDLTWYQSSSAYVRGQGRYFELYAPGGGEGAGEWRQAYAGPIEGSFTKNTVPPQSWSFDHTLAAPNLNQFEWDGGVAPRVMHGFDVQKWILTPGTGGSGQSNALEFKFVFSANLVPVTVDGFGSTQIALTFETTQRMKLTASPGILRAGPPWDSQTPTFDRNGYLYPGKYFVQSGMMAGGTLEMALTVPPPDTDNDGISDEKELNDYHTDPTKADTDGDGLSDEEEIFETFTDPLDADSDNDGFNDKYELDTGKLPKDPLSFPAAHMTIRPAVELRIVTRLGSQYMIQSSNDLTTWTDTGTVVTGTGGEVVSVFQPVEGQGKYWRVNEM